MAVDFFLLACLLLLFASLTITILYSLPGNIQCHRLEKTTPISKKSRVEESRCREQERKEEETESKKKKKATAVDAEEE